MLTGFRCFTSILYLKDDVLASLKYYPHFLLVSSFFLIMTLIVYIIVPEIRDNPHGMCKYLCMMSYIYIRLYMTCIIRKYLMLFRMKTFVYH